MQLNSESPLLPGLDVLHLLGAIGCSTWRFSGGSSQEQALARGGVVEALEKNNCAWFQELTILN